jgi:hypothetical protein
MTNIFEKLDVIHNQVEYALCEDDHRYLGYAITVFTKIIKGEYIYGICVDPDTNLELLLLIKDAVPWREVLRSRKFPETFLKKIINIIDAENLWWEITCFQNLSMKFIKKYYKKLPWRSVISVCYDDNKKELKNVISLYLPLLGFGDKKWLITNGYITSKQLQALSSKRS